MKPIELKRDTLYIGLFVNGKIFRIGTFSLLVESSGKTIYEFDIDEERYNKAMTMTDRIIPGFDPQYGWKQRHDKEMQFVYERTFHPQRQDLDEILKPFNMEAKDYNKWEFLKQSKGKCYQDDWALTDVFEETY
jgi:hypothetical protein